MSDDELPDAEGIDLLAQQYASDVAGYDVSIRDAWRDGYTSAEQRWNAAANESARLDVLDNVRLRAELARRDTAGDELAAALGVLLRVGGLSQQQIRGPLQAWRAARSDAPTETPIDVGPYPGGGEGIHGPDELAPADDTAAPDQGAS